MKLLIDISDENYSDIINHKWTPRAEIETAISNGVSFDKIRAEIMDTGAYEQEVNGKTEFLKGINYCLGVIDKYKAESEDKK